MSFVRDGYGASKIHDHDHAVDAGKHHHFGNLSARMSMGFREPRFAPFAG